MKPKPPDRPDLVLMEAPDFMSEVDATEYFYDGEAKVEGGKVYIPASRFDWQGRMLLNGYDFADPEDYKVYLERSGLS